MGKLTKDERKACMSRFSPVGLLMWRLGAVRALKDGDGLSAVWRWWHPLSWVMWMVMLPICGFVGERIAEVVPFRLTKYWRARKGEIQWL